LLLRRRLLRQRVGRLKHGIQLAALVELEQAAHGSVVAAADERAVDPDRRYRRPSHLVGEDGPDRLAFRVLVELDDRVLGIFRIKALLGLDAEGSRGEAEHQDRVAVDEAVDARPHRDFVVIARELLHERLLPLVEKVEHAERRRRRLAGAIIIIMIIRASGESGTDEGGAATAKRYRSSNKNDRNCCRPARRDDVDERHYVFLR